MDVDEGTGLKAPVLLAVEDGVVDEEKLVVGDGDDAPDEEELVDEEDVDKVGEDVGKELLEEEELLDKRLIEGVVDGLMGGGVASAV